jgi:hypothetical protein
VDDFLTSSRVSIKGNVRNMDLSKFSLLVTPWL